jgi:hypothetical protein
VTDIVALPRRLGAAARARPSRKYAGALVERRSDHAEKEKERITALKHQAADAEQKLSRLYRAIENGLADLDVRT